MQMATMKSSARAFAEFQVLVENSNALQLPYVVATEEEISNAWMAAKAERSLIDLEDLEENASENDHIHPLMHTLVQTIWNAWRVPETTPIHLSIRQTMRNPPLVPDAVVSMVNDPNWPDAMVLMEAKLPSFVKGVSKHAEGIVQGFNYLLHAVQSLPQAERAHSHRIGVFMDYESAAVFWFESGALHRPKWSGKHSLLPSGWRQLNQATPGFAWLCHALKNPPPILEPITLRNGLRCAVDSTLCRHGIESVVYAVTISQEKYAVKVVPVEAIAKLQLLVSEFLYTMTALRQIPAFRPYLLEANPLFSDLPRGIAVMPLGETLLNWYEKHERNSRNNQTPWWDECKAVLMQVVDAFRQLHGGGWMHCDVRPMNILIMGNGTVRLIDWVTACQISDRPNFFFRQGVDDPFLVDELLEKASNAAPVLHYYPKWDLFSLAYSILGICGYFNEMQRPSETENFIGIRRQRVVEVFDNFPFPIVRFAKCIYRLASTMGDGYQPHLYQQLVNELAQI
jgi:hypothetical protein